MKITVLDKVPITKQELERLQSLGDFTGHNDYCENHEERIERAREADILIASVASKVDQELLNSAQNLKFISQFSTGFDNIDLNACAAKGVKVSNVPDYCSATLSEFVFSMIINLTRDIFLADKHVEEGGWNYSLFGGVELKGKKIGIIGAGGNGAAVIKIAKGYEMEPLVFTHNPTDEKAAELGISGFVSLETLLQNSDFITLHIPLNDSTFHMFGEKEFEIMKNGAYFINTARGGIVDSQALYDALESGRVAGAALDVLEETEPVNFENVSEVGRKLIRHPNSIITPHIAFYSAESIARLSKIAVDNVDAFINNNPKNIVN